jgi:high-affinity Fe2+/Pb2+ permease
VCSFYTPQAKSAIMTYKGGGTVPHMINFGISGALLYLVVAMAMIIGLWAFIKLRGGMRKAKAAALLLAFSLVSTLILLACSPCLTPALSQDHEKRFLRRRRRC